MTYEPDDEIYEDSRTDDNTLIRQLREENRALKKALREHDQMVDEVRAKVTRKYGIEQHLVALGHPKGMRDEVEKRMGNDVSREAVVAALEDIGYSFEEESALPAPAPVPGAAELENVTRLSASVRAAAVGDSSLDPVTKINSLQSPEELEAYMRAQGLVVDSAGY